MCLIFLLQKVNFEIRRWPTSDCLTDKFQGLCGHVLLLTVRNFELRYNATQILHNLKTPF
jgi:hypothetical protein